MSARSIALPHPINAVAVSATGDMAVVLSNAEFVIIQLSQEVNNGSTNDPSLSEMIGWDHVHALPARGIAVQLCLMGENYKPSFSHGLQNAVRHLNWVAPSVASFVTTIVKSSKSIETLVILRLLCEGEPDSDILPRAHSARYEDLHCFP
jgi:hypothetical protein